jgi:putative transposase
MDSLTIYYLKFFIIRNINRLLKNKKNRRPIKMPYMYILVNIIKVLKTGMQWKYLSLDNISYKTVNKYFNFWSRNGIFSKSYYHLLSFLKHKKKKLKTTFLVTDTTFIKNYLGVDNLGKNPTDRGRKANKLSIIINNQNIPLSLSLHKANIHDSRTLIHTIKNIKDLKKNNSSISLYADKAYDNNYCNQILKYYKLNNCIIKKNNVPDKHKNKIRLSVEHFFSWIKQFRRIINRFEKKSHNYLQFVYLSIFLIVIKKPNI